MNMDLSTLSPRVARAAKSAAALLLGDRAKRIELKARARGKSPKLSYDSTGPAPPDKFLLEVPALFTEQEQVTHLVCHLADIARILNQYKKDWLVPGVDMWSHVVVDETEEE